MVSSARSQLRRKARYTALSLASLGLLALPPAPGARVALVDTTPPIVTYSVDGIEGTNDWYRGSVGGNYIVLHWSVSDPESPIISTTGCEPAIQINGPSTGTRRTCSATSDGGTTTVTTRLLKIDATPPTTTAAPSRPPNGAGWYRAPLSVGWSGTDATSGIASCSATVSYAGPDTTGTGETGSCTDNAGNSSSDTFVVRYDTVAPTTVATPSRAPNGAGWYRAPVSVDWVGSDATSGLAACSATLAYTGPDTTGTGETGSCTDNAGNSSSDTFVVRYDTVAPTTVATPSRAPNGAGWYRAPLSIDWNGTDGTSGIASCRARLTYSGPDTSGASQSGSCTDNAGNSSSDAFVVRYDATAPVTSASSSPAPNANGWLRTPLTVSWTGSDTTSGIASCHAPVGYSGPDTPGVDETGSCTDNAGNSSSDAFVVRYDATAPVTSASSSPAPNANGWLRTPLTVSWTGSDTTSGIASCHAPVGYSGPDTPGVDETGSCTDNAGNSSSDPFVVRYDTTPPNTAATPSRPPNGAGWYRAPLSISWGGTDATSGIDSCSATVNYGGPDTQGTTRSGACTDRAGNSSSDSLVVRYDATAPTGVAAAPGRAPDHDGWYNHPVAISWSGSDATSGIASCTSRSYGGPDDADANASGNCTDVAGNVTTLGFPLEYDATGPAVTVTAARTPDHDGWYNHPVAISWSGTDATSGIDSCTPPVTYGGPDSGSASSAGGCTDHAGNSASPPPLSFRYDATAPVTTAGASRSPDANGWYNHPLRVTWSGTDPVSGVAACSSLAYGGPDSGGVSRSGSCTDRAGNSSAASTVRFRYDATAPTGLGVSAARPPDHDGWYNHPLGIRWSGVDATAGIAACTSLTYGSPDATGGRLSGRCTDRAGNASAPLGFGLRYDETPPSLSSLVLKPLDGAVALRWRVTGADALVLSRAPASGTATSTDVYSGGGSTFTDKGVENYVRYRYTLAASDAAGNVVHRSGFATPRPVLFAPRPGAHLRVHARPLFAWRPAKRARYYNFQLWRDGKRVGSWWPTATRLRLPSRWQADGEAQRLEAGDYTWYVWPGRGARRLARYGPLLGKSTFAVG